MSSIYRLRPIGHLTIEELTEPYLWFSLPSEYKDSDDANILAFVDSNEQILESFERIYKDYEEVAKLAAMSGICCFTKSIPPTSSWKKFPKAHNGILVEYDKELIENHFLNTRGLGNCFQNVEYTSKPTLFDSHNRAILWQSDGESQVFKPMRLIESDPRLMDQLFLRMFTRISDKFSTQNEVRIILGGRNIPSKAKNLKGYKVQIPEDSVKRIYTNSNTPASFISQLESLKIQIERA